MLTIKKVTLPLAATVLCYTITAGSAFAAEVVFLGTETKLGFTDYKYQLNYLPGETPAPGHKFKLTIIGGARGLFTILDPAQGVQKAEGSWEPTNSGDELVTTHTWTRNNENAALNVADADWGIFIIRASSRATEPSNSVQWFFNNDGGAFPDNPAGNLNGPVPIVPEPLTILGTGFAAAALPALKRANKKAKK